MLHCISYLSLWAFTLTNQTTKRIGFACKWINNPDEINGMKINAADRDLNTGTTTVAWLNRQTRDVAEQRLWKVMQHNLSAIYKLVERVGSLEQNRRMVRLSSDILPLYTEINWNYFWKKPDVISYCEKNFALVGELARANDVRLSFHPGQFTVLASDREEVVNRSIEEFEYHCDMVRWMGYGKTFQDFKVNVHISGRKGPQGIRDVYNRLSPEARNTLTLENEEYTHGLSDCLSLSDLVPTVLDIHHHSIREGEYIQSTDDRIKMVIDSWRGVRPTIHYSISREDVLVNHSRSILPDVGALIDSGHNKQKLRAHSDYMWSDAANNWAYTHWDWADVMVEAKAKNLASFKLFERYKHGTI